MKLKFPAASALKGERVVQGLTIFDMTHGSVGMANSQTYGLCKLATQVGSDYYPEIMGNVFVCNAPMLFSGIWAVVKGFMDEKTRAKIKIIGSNYMPTLTEYIDIQNIPEFMGGQCKCEHVEGGCINSNIGPWNDYEIHGYGIRRKGTGEAAEESKQEEAKTEEVKQQDGAAPSGDGA